MKEESKFKVKNKVIIFGVKDLSELAHYYLMNDSSYKVEGFTVNKKYLTSLTLYLKVLKTTPQPHSRDTQLFLLRNYLIIMTLKNIIYLHPLLELI